MTAWNLTELSDGVLRLAINVPGEKQNVLSEAVMNELEAALDAVEKRLREDAAGVRGLLVASDKKNTFIAGADVRVLAEIPDAVTARRLSRRGQDLFHRIATLPVPKVAAVVGPCLGGGYEMALACDRIVAGESDATKIGLPETKLGILPGWGGCVRLPRRVGLLRALDYILEGKTVSARRAARDGLVDGVAPPALVEEYALRLIREGLPPRRPLRPVERFASIFPFRGIVLAQAKKKVLAKSKGHYPNLPEAVDAIGACWGRPFGEALEVEADAFARVAAGPRSVAKNLCRVFFLTEAAKKKARGYSKNARPVRQAGVVGAGVMGGGIAWALARAGLLVRLVDIREEALVGAMAEIDEILAGEVRREKCTRSEAAAARARVLPAVFEGPGKWDGFGVLDLVVEAVVENLDVKKQVFSEVAKAAPNAVLATNTSALPIAEMGAASGSPERVAGLHFFNPVHRMPLVEVIAAEGTSDETLGTLFSVAKRLGKTPVLCKDAPGFIVNRILLPYLLEAVSMVEEGVGIVAIDRAAEDFGMPMGPIRLADEVGLDVALHVGKFLAEAFPDRVRLPATLASLVAKGHLGKKTGRGFYAYDGKKPRPAVAAGAVGLPPEEIRERLFPPMVEEGRRILEEGVAESADDIDLAMILGTGFPPFRGGLFAGDSPPSLKGGTS